jgi:hypothetical protein
MVLGTQVGNLHLSLGSFDSVYQPYPYGICFISLWYFYHTSVWNLSYIFWESIVFPARGSKVWGQLG